VREERRIARTVDHVLATCTDEVFELARLGARARRISVVPCGVDLAAFGPDGPCAPRDRRPRIVCLGRLVPRKGVDDAVRALALLPAAELVVSGGPPAGGLRADPEARRLRALADALGVGNRVTLTGAVARDRIPALLRSADVVVCAPWYEPFGIVPLEAMACARPVVSSAVGGLVDTVVHERTGLHVPPRDPRALADAVARLLADPALARRLGEAGLRRARARYSWDRVATQTAEVYRRVAGRHPARRRAAAW
jgi:glycosyltransferase involved in cell wall biosynthesis